MARQITCITKPDVYNTHETITHVGGSGFYITRLECANDIDAGRESYFVKVGTDRAEVTTYVKNGVQFIKTTPAWTQRDNPLCPPKC